MAERKLLPLSNDAADARTPLAPWILADALQDPIPYEGRGRPARTVRNKHG